MLLFFAMGCNYENTGISRLRVGVDGDAESYIGQRLLLQARLSAETGIRYADIEIRPLVDEGWTFTQRYVEKFAGKKRVTFAEDIAVPPTADAGDYQLALRVTDHNDITVSETTTFKLIIDHTVPIATDLDVGINAAGNDLHLETQLTAPEGIKKVRVKIKGDSWDDELIFSGKRVVGQLSHHFHEHVPVGEAPSGNYRVTVWLVDQKDREFQTEGAFTKP